MLATTIRKTFLQPGSGRREEALTRGSARLGTPGLITKVLNLLISEGLLKLPKAAKEHYIFP
jgi:hypothetical protein